MKSSWLSPAKLNLFLHITGQRSDGYHNLQTIFQFLDYCDEITIEQRDDGLVQLMTPIEGVDDEDNLIIKAARLLQTQASYKQTMGANIQINKILPIGGGLGGGSSNAATTLVALNSIWQLGLTKNQLKSRALKLGADVPVFVHGESCAAKGIGEHFEAVELEASWYLIIVPDCHVNTGEIFSDPTLTRNSKTIRIHAPTTWKVLGTLRNDCESLVKDKYPEVKQALTWLSQFGIARMTGTGSCVFSVFSSEQKAREIADDRPEGTKAIITRGVNQSPLYRTFSIL